MTNWKEYKLGDLVTFQRGHDLPRTEMIEGIYPVAGSNSIIGFHDKFTTKGIGITIGRSGNIGNPQLHKTNFWAHNTTLYIKEFKKVDPTFFYYLLTTLDFSQLNSGSAVPSLNRNFIHPYVVSIPDDYETQTAIAEILSSLDDKIELNNKINQELENLAQTLFKQWFIDFEFPNQNGDPYKSSGGEMIDSELGEIPKGWEVINIQDLGKIICGKTPSKKISEYYGSDMPFIKIPDMHKNTYIVNSIDNLSVKGYNSQTNKTLPKNSIVVSSIATVGLVSLTSMPSQTNQQINSIIPKVDWLTFYIYDLCKSLNDNFIQLASGGSATLNMNTSTFKNISILQPTEAVLKSYHFLVVSLFEQIEMNTKENQELTNLRDTLLPKLISGELEVNNHNF